MTLRFAALGMRIHAHGAIADVLAAGDTQLVAIADDDPGVCATAADRYGVPTYTDWRTVLDQHALDLAIICPPHDQKAAIVVACLTAGIHALVDKTMAVTDAGLERIEAALASSQAHLSMYLTERFGTTFVALKEIIARGDLGRIAGCSALRPHEIRASERTIDAWVMDPAQEGGVIVDLVVHDIDLVRWYPGREVAEVWARQHRAGFAGLPADWPAMGMALFVLDDGTPAMLEASRLAHAAAHTVGLPLLVTGTEGAAEIKSLGFTELTIWRPDQPHQPVAVPPARTDGPGRDLIRRIRGQSPIILSAADAVAATRAVLAARTAAQTGQPVRLRTAPPSLAQPEDNQWLAMCGG